MDRNLKLLARCFDSHGLSSNILLSPNFSRDKHFFMAFRWCKWEGTPKKKERKIWWLDLYHSHVAHCCNANFHGNFFQNIYTRNLHSWIGWPIHNTEYMNKIKHAYAQCEPEKERKKPTLWHSHAYNKTYANQKWFYWNIWPKSIRTHTFIQTQTHLICRFFLFHFILFSLINTFNTLDT